MSVNILDLINTAVGSQLLAKIAALIGEDEQKTATAFRSAVPAILGGLIAKSETLDGAEQVSRSLSGFNGGVLQNFESIISGGELENFSKIGTGVSQAIFGSKYDSAISAVAQYSGVNPLASATMLGLVTPVVLGVLGHEKDTNLLDREGLTRLLDGQKLHLLQGTPHELMSALGLRELFVAKTDTTPVEPTVAAPSADPSTAVVEKSSVAVSAKSEQTRRKKSGGLLKVLVPLLLIAAVGYGGWLFVQKRGTVELSQRNTVPPTTQTSLETVTERVPEQTPGDLNTINAEEVATVVTDAANTDNEAEVVELQAVELSADVADVELTADSVETQIDVAAETQVEEPVDALAVADVETVTDSSAFANDAQETIASFEVPSANAGDLPIGETTEIADTAASNLDEVADGAVEPTALPTEATSEETPVVVIAEPLAESMPEEANVVLTDETGFEAFDESTTSAVPWEPQEAVLETRTVTDDAAQRSLELVEPTAPAGTASDIEMESTKPTSHRDAQVITGQPYQGGVVEEYQPQGVIETYRPHQVNQPRVIQGQPYEGGVIYNAVPNTSEPLQDAIVEQPTQPQDQLQYYQPQYSQPRGLFRQSSYPRGQYYQYQGQYYELAPYQRPPLFNGRAIRRIFPLFN